MRRRAVSAVLAAALLAAAFSLSACGRRAPSGPAPRAELAKARELADEHRNDEALKAYMKLAERTQVGGQTFDLAMAGVASAFTSTIATMTLTGQVDAITTFYQEYAPRLHPPALVTYTTSLLDSAAEEQVAWSEAFYRDRSRWLRELGARGRAAEEDVRVRTVDWRTVELMTPAEARRVSAAVPRLYQPASMAELYGSIVALAEANRVYVSLARGLEDGGRPSQAQIDDAIKANAVVARELPRAKALLAPGR